MKSTTSFRFKLIISICEIMCILGLYSCGTKKTTLLPLPSVSVTYNYYEFAIQNMDENAKCDNGSLTAYYDGFNMLFSLNESCQLSLIIENRTNKSLILDKAKCFVLYDGYSKELFKDVRTGKVTTYDNVQDAISSVHTNESSVTLSIPPYSKWKLPISETNIEKTKFPTIFYWEAGDHSLTPYTTNFTTEFIIPYTYDYALAKWNTARNRLFIGNVHSEKRKEILELGSFPLYSPYVVEGFSSGKFFHAEASPEDLELYRQIAIQHIYSK